MKCNHVIEYEAARPLKLGDVLYSVEPAEPQNFCGTCEMCEGAGKITVNKITVRCPLCRGELNSQVEPFVLSVDRYTVRRWRVCSVIESRPADDWKPKNPIRRLRFELYSKVDRGWGGTETRSVIASDGCLKPNFDGAFVNSFYDKYASAKAQADELNGIARKQIGDYNAAHNTEFEFEEPVYDKRST